MSLLGFGVIAFIIYVAVKKNAQVSQDRAAGVSVNAGVIEKKEYTREAQRPAGDLFGTGYEPEEIVCKVTFQVEGGSRMTFEVDRYEYAILSEGDYGVLSYNSAGYLGFRTNGNIR